MKGLIASIFADKRLGNCSNHGISETCSEVVIVGMGISSEVFDDKPDRPAVKLVFRIVAGNPVVHAEPVHPVKNGNVGWMMGGCYIATSDSRLGEFLRVNGFTGYMAIPLHDRQETYAEYEALSK
jgi:hypothetical protein